MPRAFEKQKQVATVALPNREGSGDRPHIRQEDARIVKKGPPERGAQTTDKPCISSEVQGFEIKNQGKSERKEATSLLMF